MLFIKITCFHIAHSILFAFSILWLCDEVLLKDIFLHIEVKTIVLSLSCLYVVRWNWFQARRLPVCLIPRNLHGDLLLFFQMTAQQIVIFVCLIQWIIISYDLKGFLIFHLILVVIGDAILVLAQELCQFAIVICQLLILAFQQLYSSVSLAVCHIRGGYLLAVGVLWFTMFQWILRDCALSSSFEPLLDLLGVVVSALFVFSIDAVCWVASVYVVENYIYVLGVARRLPVLSEPWGEKLVDAPALWQLWWAVCWPRGLLSSWRQGAGAHVLKLLDKLLVVIHLLAVSVATVGQFEFVVWRLARILLWKLAFEIGTVGFIINLCLLLHWLWRIVLKSWISNILHWVSFCYIRCFLDGLALSALFQQLVNWRFDLLFLQVSIVLAIAAVAIIWLDQIRSLRKHVPLRSEIVSLWRLRCIKIWCFIFDSLILFGHISIFNLKFGLYPLLVVQSIFVQLRIIIKFLKILVLNLQLLVDALHQIIVVRCLGHLVLQLLVLGSQRLDLFLLYLNYSLGLFGFFDLKSHFLPEFV